MKVAVVRGPGQLELAKLPMPRVGPYDCLVKIDACATCTGTDSSIIAGTFAFLQPYPVALGHESTGIITEVGEKVRHFVVGQRVTRPAAVLPGESAQGINSNWGGFAEWGLVRDTLAMQEDGEKGGGMGGLSRVPLPQDVDPVSAALSINQREILSVVKHMEPTADCRIAVVGSGYNGLLFAFFARHFGAGTVTMLGSPGREGLARESFGADAYVSYRAADAVAQARAAMGGDPSHLVDAVGSVASVKLSESLLGPDTAFGCYGVHEHAAVQPLTKAMLADRPELAMHTDEPGATDEWYAMWKAGEFAREGMCGGLLPLSEIGRAFDLLARRQAVKLVLMP